MDETSVVTAFLRHRGDVVLLERSEAVGSYQGMWGAVAGHAEDDPETAVRREIREETGIDAAELSLIRTGAQFPVADPDLDTRWIVHPYLFDCPTRAVRTNWETRRHEWVPPPAILRRETVPRLWDSYDRVRPTVEDVATDSEHGAGTLSLRALDHLRDEAALLATRDHGDGWDSIVDVALRLIEARPAMTVVPNRIDRVMDAASDAASPAAVERHAHRERTRGARADEEAGRGARGWVDGARVGTLSRSSTVLAALEQGTPEAVLVAESRPGREGIDVADRLAVRQDLPVAVTTDAAFPHELLAWNADVLLVGADSILPDGRVLNKVGTRAAATVAARAGIAVVVVAASDKISPATDPDREPRAGSELYDGDEPLTVRNPTFDLTPPGVVDAVVTEDGSLDVADVRTVATAHRERSQWR